MDWIFQIPPHAIAAFLQPFALFALMTLVVVPISRLLWKVIPEGPLKDLLYDRTLQERRPSFYGTVWLVLMVTLVVSLVLISHL